MVTTNKRQIVVSNRIANIINTINRIVSSAAWIAVHKNSSKSIRTYLTLNGGS